MENILVTFCLLVFCAHLRVALLPLTLDYIIACVGSHSFLKLQTCDIYTGDD